MKAQRLHWILRGLIALLLGLAVGASLLQMQPGWLGLLAAVPPLAVLAISGSAGFWTFSVIAVAVELIIGFAMDAFESGSPYLASLFCSLASLAITIIICFQYLSTRESRGHGERQILEDLDEEIANLNEKVVESETALTRNENKRKRYSKLQDANVLLGTTLELETLAKLILEQIAHILHDHQVTITLFILEGGGKELLRCELDNGAHTPYPPETSISSDPLNQWVLSRGTTLIIRDLEKDFRFRGLDIHCLAGRCFYLSPLVSSQGQIAGLVRVEALQKDAIDNEDQRLLESLVVLASLSVENAKLYRETQELAITDGLTKLLLRRQLLERLGTELLRAEQNANPLSFILMDIDHFKSVNDTYGHPAGDKVLREIAQLLKKRVRDVDLCGRYGGEEFAVFLPATDVGGAKLVAERIRDGIRKEGFELKGETRTITVSLGVASFPQDAKTVESLIERADEALYRSKERGRDRVTAFNEG